MTYGRPLLMTRADLRRIAVEKLRLRTSGQFNRDREWLLEMRPEDVLDLLNKQFVPQSEPLRNWTLEEIEDTLRSEVPQ